MDKNLDEPLYHGRPLIKKMNRTSRGIASMKDFQDLEYEELATDKEIEQEDEMLLEDELDSELSVFDNGSYTEPVKPDNSLNTVIVRAVELAKSKNLLPRNWQQDQDYVDAVTDIVKKSVNKPTGIIKQAIKNIYG